MKTRLFVLVLTLAAFSLRATPIAMPAPAGKMFLHTYQASDGDMVLRLVNLQARDTRVTFTHLDRQQVYYRTTVRDHNGFATELVLRDAPNGRYLLQVAQTGTTLTQVIVVKNGALTFSNVVEKIQ